MPPNRQLLAAFDRMATSGQAAMVTVSGYSGIGKSALAGELHQPIFKKHGYFISGKFDQYQRDIPYVPLTQAFRELVQQLLAESEARISDWRQQIQTALGANGQLIVDVLSQVELIIGKQAISFVLDLTELKRAEEALRKAHEELERRVEERTSELQQSNRQLESEVMERKRAEVVLAQRSQELARSNAELEQMAYVASHDLQEPLRSLPADRRRVKVFASSHAKETVNLLGYLGDFLFMKSP